MENKKYLKWYQKVAYGTGDLGSNFMYTFVATFILFFSTDILGLNSAIVGVLMAVSKVFDGVTDIFFGTLIDKTHNKMGKARPWMFWSTFPLAICEILLFMVPNAAPVIQYGYFFVVYTVLNAIFYTANNIAYASLTALITKNPSERVQLGSIRFIFALVAGIVISSATVSLANGLGGGVTGWRIVAVIYSLVLVLFDLLAVLTVKEVPEDAAPAANTAASTEEKGNLIRNFKLLLRNRFYIVILIYYIVYYAMSGVTQGIGTFFCIYTLGSADLLGLISIAGMIPMIVGLILTPILVSKFGIYRVNLIGMIVSLVCSFPVILFGYSGNFAPFLFFTALKGLGSSPMLGTLNAVIADAATYTYLKDGVHLDGTMFSCSSMGIKVGGGLGTALSGILLDLGGYVGQATEQTAGAISMINFMYLWIPTIITVIMTVLVAMLNVDKANKELQAKKQTA